MTRTRIHVDYMARVEGEAAVTVEMAGDRVERVAVNVFEPPRFFEGFLVGRKFDEVPGLVSRICGICPVSHQLTAILALEKAFGVIPSRQTAALRDLLALAQIFQSHVLHIYMLALPDYLGYRSAIEMAGVANLRPAVERALGMKRLANDLTACIGGREVHPVTPAVGGFTSLPDVTELKALRNRLEEGKADVEATVRLVAGLELPRFERVTEFVSLKPDAGYPLNTGRVVSSGGVDIPVEEYRQCFREEHVPHSNALHSRIVGRGSFLVGPLARVNLNFDRLSPWAQSLARGLGVAFPSFNPFHGIAARTLELAHSIDESIRIIDDLLVKDGLRDEMSTFEVRAGESASATEAPRGLLYHRYRLDGKGVIQAADIVTPTAHNVSNLEDDLVEFVPTVADLPREQVALRCEMMVRNYDPCFSCSAHLVRLEVRIPGGMS